MIAATGENLKDVCKAVAWLGPDEIAVHDDCYIFRHQMDPKFVSYFFQSSAFQEQKAKFASESKVVRVSGANLAKINMPVPPLAIQREITAILDKMELLEAELEAELEYRSLQYAHYRDSLLGFGVRERVRWATLSEVGSLYGGLTGKAKADFQGGNARFASYMNVFNNLVTNTSPDDFVRLADGERQNRVRFGDVLFTASSESAAGVGMSSAVTAEPSEALYLNSFCFGFRPNDTRELNPEFAKHLFRSAGIRRQIVRTANGVTRFNISKVRFREVEIPLPEPDEQRRLATVLDRFEALANDLSVGLPAEITARRQQYEYYRDRLFTFEEMAA